MNKKFEAISLSFISILLLAGCVSQRPETPKPVVPVDPEHGDIEEENITLAIGQTYTLNYSVGPENADTNKINWSSEDSDFATVRKGVVTAKEVTDDVKIYLCNYSNTVVFDQCSFKIVKQIVPAERIEIKNNNITMSKNQTFKLNWSITPLDSTSNYVWTSSNPEVAEVEKDGTVASKENGQTVIKVKTDNGKEAECVVNVQHIDVQSVSINTLSDPLYLYTTRQLEAVILPENASNQSLSWSSSDPETIFVSSEGKVTAKKIGKATITVAADNNKVSTIELESFNTPELEKKELKYTCYDFSANSVYQQRSIPNKGNPKLLIIPVWFKDSDHFISASNKSLIREDIKTAFLGTNEETGWRSVKTFYADESFGQVNMQGKISDWYYYDEDYLDVSSNDTNSIIIDACTWYKKNNSDYSSFDTDKDGYLDAVMLIYAAPDNYAGNHENNNLWAYCYWTFMNAGTASNPNPNAFFWASYDFLYGYNRGDRSAYYGGDTSHCTIDTHCFIHEMGHIFGLSDYYDYSGDAGYSAAGGFTMQDHNVGAHDPYSKMSLGWIKPYVPTETTTITIHPTEESGDVILLTPRFNNSPFDEYILIDFYSPTGLNKFDSDYHYDYYYPQGPQEYGCRIWHIDGRLTQWTGYKFSGLYTRPVSDCARAISNSTAIAGTNDGRGSLLGGEYNNYRELQLIRKNYTKDPKCNDTFSRDSMFYTGDIFDIEGTYKNVFHNKGLLNSKTELGWKVEFNHVSNDAAVITLTKTN